MAKNIASIVIAGLKVVGRAFTRAVQQEYQASQQAAKARSSSAGTNHSAAANAYSGITLQEAMQILNIKDINDLEAIKKNYDHLFEVNDKTKGGSFYLQSKIVRAKERIDQEIHMAREAEKEGHPREEKPDT